MHLPILSRTAPAAVALALAICANPAHSQETQGFEGSHEGAVELTYDRSDSAQDILSLTVEYTAALRVAAGWTVQLDAVVEAVEDADDSVAFDELGAFVETLSVQYAGEGFTVYAGKINPVFGSAADLAPGLYGAEVGEEYQITEQMGFGGDVLLPSLPGLPGEHVLSIAAFAADRTLLSGSIGAHRQRVRLDDGGLSNTKGLDSFAVSLDGALETGLGYTLGYRRLASDTPGEASETAFVAGASYVTPEEAGIDLALVAEVALSRNADGLPDAERNFYTAGLTWSTGPWFVSAIASGWDENDVAGDADLGKYELSFGRELADGLTLDLGAQQISQGDENETVIGARLTFGFN